MTDLHGNRPPANPPLHERDRIGEIQDRLRRIETRMTKWMQQCGFDTQVQKATWDEDNAEVHIPSLDIRLRDILIVIPTNCDRVVEVRHQGELVISIDDFPKS